jgi:MFS family permease
MPYLFEAAVDCGDAVPRPKPLSSSFYRRFLIFIAGMGGLLYGIDVGIIAAALLYLGKAVDLSVEQKSLIVAAVLGGSMLSSPVAGMLADWFGRKRMMVVSGLLFVISIGLIFTSQGFVELFVGRLLQGMSGGVIAVVVPLYLAETLKADLRGRGTAIFQFMLTFGIVMASLIGYYYTHQAEHLIALAAGHPAVILAAENHAWRSMFLAIIYPGLVFFAGSMFLGESPRWLFRRGRVEQALRALEKSTSHDEAERELKEMQALAAERDSNVQKKGFDSLLQRKYVIPFLLACAILSLNTATGINSVLSFIVVILKKAGLTPTLSTQGDIVVTVLNCVATLIGVALVDRKGRRFLLKAGTAGIVFSMIAAGLIFLRFESRQVNVRARVVAAQSGNEITMPVSDSGLGMASTRHAMALTVLYRYGSGEHIATVVTSSAHPELKIVPAAKDAHKALVVELASYGPVPPESTGWLIALCLGAFICSYAAGPGVVVWLALSELMPTRIRSRGMGIALLLNQGVSTLMAYVFLPVVAHFGYYAMFFIWAGCAVLYFLTATLFLPETKGKTLEEIELYFEGAGG